VDVTSTCTTCSGASAQPFPTIGQAFSQLPDSNTLIYLNKGVYTGLGNKNLNLSSVYINIIGDSAGDTVVDCQGDGYAFQFTSGTFLLANVTIQNCFRNTSTPQIGNFSGGAAISVTSTYTQLDNVVIRNNTAKGLGGAIFILSNSVLITNSVIVGSHSDLYGGGVFIQSASLETYNTTITQNTDRTGNNDVFCFNGAVNLDNNSTAGAVFCEQCSISKDHVSLCRGNDDISHAHYYVSFAISTWILVLLVVFA